MSIHTLRRWHWAAIGLTVGMALGFARHMGDSVERVGGPGFLTQAQFEHSLRVPPVQGKRYVGGIRIRRTPSVDMVTLQLLSPRLGYEDARFAAPHRYRPLGDRAGGMKPDYSVGNTWPRRRPWTRASRSVKPGGTRRRRWRPPTACPGSSSSAAFGRRCSTGSARAMRMSRSTTWTGSLANQPRRRRRPG